MSYLTIIFIVWGVFLAGLLCLLAYNATLTRYEEDQLFLNEGNDMEKRHQTEILTKLSKTQPLVRIFGGASALLTIALVGIFAWDALQRLR